MIVMSVLGLRGAGMGMPGRDSFAKIFVSLWLLASTSMAPAVAVHMTFNVVSGGIAMILTRVMMARQLG